MILFLNMIFLHKKTIAYKETDMLKLIYPENSYHIHNVSNSNLDSSYIFIFIYKTLVT